MEFAPSARTEELKAKLVEFDNEIVRPAEPIYRAQREESGDPHFPPPVMEELKVEARKRDLWNLFLPEPEHGPGLSNLEYAPLCEVMGTSPLLGEATNCSAPDTGNMEILAQFGTQLQQEQWLRPLLDGEIRSCFAMTEPWVASSDATNISSRIERDGDDYVINGHKWFTSGALDPRCKMAVFMGVTDPDTDTYHRQSMILVPMDAPGVKVVRGLPVFGHSEGGGHGDACHQDNGDDDRPSALVHGWFLSRVVWTDEPVDGAPPTHYRGYAAVTPPSTLMMFPVDLAERGPTKNAIASATSSGSTATPSFVRPW